MKKPNKPKAKKIPSSKRTGLLEAWIGYIYEGNTCPSGLKALHFLRECLQKGILTDGAIWGAASDEIKTAFYGQFSRPPMSKKAKSLRDRFDKLTDALIAVEAAKGNTKDILAQVKAAQAKFEKAIPAGLAPQGRPHRLSDILRPRW